MEDDISVHASPSRYTHRPSITDIDLRFFLIHLSIRLSTPYCIYLHTLVFIYRSIYPLIHLSICLSACLLVCVSIYVLICSSICRSVYMCVHPSVYLWVFISIRPSIHPSIHHYPSTHLSTYPTNHPSTHPSIHPSIITPVTVNTTTYLHIFHTSSSTATSSYQVTFAVLLFFTVCHIQNSPAKSILGNNDQRLVCVVSSW